MALYYAEHPRSRYFEGDCAAFAVELSHLTGLPLGAVLDHDEGRTVLVHAFVYLPENGEILDAAGLSCLESVLQEFPRSEEAWDQRITEEELLCLAYDDDPAPDKDEVIRDVRQMLLEDEVQEHLAASKSMPRP